MATWNEVKGMLQSNFPTQMINDKMIGLKVPITETRTQNVIVIGNNSDLFGETFQICSCIGKIPNHKLPEALLEVFDRVIGGIVAYDGDYYLRENIQASEYHKESFLKQMGSIAVMADVMEEKYIGGDKY